MRGFDSRRYTEGQNQAWITGFAFVIAISALSVPAIIFYLIRVQAGWTYTQAATAAGLLSLTYFPAVAGSWSIPLRYSFLGSGDYVPRGTIFLSDVAGGWLIRLFGLTTLSMVNGVIGTFGIGFAMTPGRRSWGVLLSFVALLGLVALTLKFSSFCLSRAAEKGHQPTTPGHREFEGRVARAALLSMGLAWIHVVIWLAAAYVLLFERSWGLMVLLLLAGAALLVVSYIFNGVLLRKFRREFRELPSYPDSLGA